MMMDIAESTEKRRMKYFFKVCLGRQISNKLKRVVLLVLVFSSMVTLAENEESPNNAVNLSSLTTRHSAAFCLGKLNGQEKEDDLGRLTIGVGETVILTLSGKQVDKSTKVEWSVQGKGASLFHNDGNKAILQADVSMVKERDVTVTAKTNLGAAKLTFTILCPSGIEGVSKRQLETNDGVFGVRGEICVTISPISVSFNGLSVLEKDKGIFVQQRHEGLGWVGGMHGTNPRPKEIDEKNQFTDGVEYLISRSLISMDPRPLTPEQCIVKWYWKCACHLDGQTEEISDVNQYFEVVIGKSPKAIIKKFSATFTNKN